MRAQRSILDKTSEQVLKYLKSRLTTQQLQALSLDDNSMFTEQQKRKVPLSDQGTEPKPSVPALPPQTAAIKSISLPGKNLTKISDIREHYPDINFSQIKSLNLSKNKISDLSGIEEFVNLLDLDLSQNLISDQTLTGNFSHFPEKLNSINLNNNQISTTSADHFFSKFTEIAKTKFLTILLLGSNKIAKIEAAEFLKFKNLNTLDLSSNSISQVPPLLGEFKNSNLKRLNLEMNSFRVPRIDIMNKGTEAILAYLYDRIPR